MKKLRKLVALGGLLLLVSSGGMCTQRIGWVVPSQFHEAPQDPARPSRTFYLDGESPEHWTERVRIEQAELPADMSFKAELDAEHKAAGETCPDIYITTFPPQQEAGTRIFAEMRQCPEDSASHRAAVSVRRMILDGNTLDTIIAEGDYPPVPKGKTPLLKQQLSRWMDFVNSFSPCLDSASPGCLRDPTELVNATAAPLGTDESALIQQIEARGEDMYRQDQLAWHSSDVLRERNLQPPSGDGGFLAIPEGTDSGKFFIIADKPNGYAVLYVVTTDARGFHLVSDGTKDDLSPEVAIRFRARQTAMQASPAVCAPHPNTIVLPTEDDDGWWVYVMTASSDSPRMWIGGHTRFRISKDGLHVLASEPSAKSCLGFDLGDPRMAYAMMTHLLSDTPTEFHVMQSLTWHKPMFVGTRTGIWKVDGDSIIKLQLPSGIH